MTTTVGHKLFVFGAAVGIAGWMFLLALLGYWYLQPVHLPNVTQPLPVLNDDRVVDVGETILLRLDVVKSTPLQVATSDRYITCEGGNLIPLSSNPVRLPVGAYTIVSDTVVLPPKALPGEVCTVHFEVVYHVNPVRDEGLHISSEPFTVGEYPPGVIGTPLEDVR